MATIDENGDLRLNWRPYYDAEEALRYALGYEADGSAQEHRREVFDEAARLYVELIEFEQRRLVEFYVEVAPGHTEVRPEADQDKPLRQARRYLLSMRDRMADLADQVSASELGRSGLSRRAKNGDSGP